MLRVGLIGFGAIGRAFADLIREGKAGETRLAAVLVRAPARIEAELAARHDCQAFGDAAEFLATDLDLVVEAAGQPALLEYAEDVLRQGKDLMAVSVGAFSDGEFFARVLNAARERGRRVYLPSGAIAGLDAIGAAAIGGLDEVTLTTRKPPRTLLPADQAEAVLATGEPRTLFEGVAAEAVRRFPESVNVSAALSLAGLGMERTRVRVVADPVVSRNTHEVLARGWFGQLRLTIENVPSENPRTGRIVALSLARALRNLTEPLVVG